jgi:hypothetical protein
MGTFSFMWRAVSGMAQKHSAEHLPRGSRSLNWEEINRCYECKTGVRPQHAILPVCVRHVKDWNKGETLDMNRISCVCLFNYYSTNKSVWSWSRMLRWTAQALRLRRWEINTPTDQLDDLREAWPTNSALTADMAPWVRESLSGDQHSHFHRRLRNCFSATLAPPVRPTKSNLHFANFN